MDSVLVWAAIVALAVAAVCSQLWWRDLVGLARRIHARVPPALGARALVLLALLAAANYLAARHSSIWSPADGITGSELGTEPLAYFTTGHGERDPGSIDRFGYSAIASSLRQQRTGIGTLDLASVPAVPGDATLVIVAGPKLDFAESEIDALRQYLTRGGSLLLLIDPVADLKRYVAQSGTVLFMIDPTKPLDSPELTRLVELVRQWGVTLGNDIVMDMSGMGEYLGTDASVPVAARYPGHAITERLSVLTAFPVARSVTPVAEHARDATVSALVETGAQSWAETDVRQLTSGGAISMDRAQGDRHGPITLGAAVTARTEDGDARLVVLGDSDFAANYVGNIPGNVDLFVAAVRWLAREKATDADAQSGRGGGGLSLTAGQRTWMVALFGLVPAVFIGAGVYVWRRRPS